MKQTLILFSALLLVHVTPGHTSQGMPSVGEASDTRITPSKSPFRRPRKKLFWRRDETWKTFAALAARQDINLHLTFETTLKFSDLADFSRPNVFVIEGSKGTPSPYVKHSQRTTP